MILVRLAKAPVGGRILFCIVKMTMDLHNEAKKSGLFRWISTIKQRSLDSRDARSIIDEEAAMEKKHIYRSVVSITDLAFCDPRMIG